MEKVFKIWRNIYWTFILDYTKEHWKKEWNYGKMFAYIACCFCTEGAHKSVQLHNIGSMCVTALPTQISLVWPLIMD